MDYRSFSLRTVQRLHEVCQKTPEVELLLLKLTASIKEDSTGLLKLLDGETQRQATQIASLETLVGKFEGIVKQQTETLESAVEENEALTTKVSQMEQEIQSLKARLTRKPKLAKKISTMPIVYDRLSGTFGYVEPKSASCASAESSACAESCGQSADHLRKD
jgi:chromosome segregation ATPase